LVFLKTSFFIFSIKFSASSELALSKFSRKLQCKLDSLILPTLKSAQPDSFINCQAFLSEFFGFLKGNKKIMLGRYDYNQQINNLNKVLIQSKDEKFTYIDLRLKNKIFVK